MLELAATSGQTVPGTYSQTLNCGNFFLVISLVGSTDEVNLELGRNTLTKIEEIVTQTPEIAAAELVGIIAAEFTNGIALHLVAAKIEEQNLSLAARGEVGAEVFREGKIIKLSGAKTITGTLHHGDILILGTKNFFEIANLREYIANGSESAIELRDKVLLKTEALENNSGIAAMFIKMDLVEEKTELMEQSEEGKEEKNKRIEFKKFAKKFYLRRPYDPNAPPPAYRKTLYLVILALLTLVSAVAFQLRSKALEERTSVVLAMEKSAKDGLDSANKLAGVNDNVARQVLLQTRADFVNKAASSFGNDWPSELKTTLIQLDSQLATVSHIYTLAGLGLFYDFGLLKPNAKIVGFDLHKEVVVALDQNNGAVYTLATQNKSAAIVTGTNDLKAGLAVDYLGDNIYVLTPNGILVIDQTAGSPAPKVLIKNSDKWGSILGLKLFGGNIYLLDKGNSQVWKYQGTDLGFADIAPYLKAQSVDFSRVTSWAIDGYVYVLSASGSVVKFASGMPENFDLTNLDKPLNNPTSIFANDETNNLYVLDSGNNRVVVFDKTGNYLAQYLLPAGNSFAGLLVDETVKRVFLLAESKVYSFDLK